MKLRNREPSTQICVIALTACSITLRSLLRLRGLSLRLLSSAAGMVVYRFEPRSSPLLRLGGIPSASRPVDGRLLRLGGIPSASRPVDGRFRAACQMRKFDERA